LILAGGFDCFENTHRAQYFHTDGDGITFYEKAIRFGAKFQENENSSQVSLFGDTSDVQISEPVIPPCEEWNTMEKLAKEKEVVGIYISGHPLDDYRFEMKYFCNNKLESLKSLEQYVGKNLSFGGIVTNVQHRTAKNGKGWATFVLEGYDETNEFRIFNEEYLKFRHFLVQNQFVYIRVNIKDGWVNRETGKKSDPQINFLQVESIQDVLRIFAKKLVIHLDIKELHEELVSKLIAVFAANKGDNTVSFDILELEKTKKQIEVAPIEADDIEIVLDENGDIIEDENPETVAPTEVEETKIINKISMNSRKLKINISTELLNELEKLQVNFKLN
jgi:DNA polymerase-3 subunit alpha